MGSEFSFRLTEKAADDLDGIVSYITEELSNPKAAVDFLGKLRNTIHETQMFPESGTVITNDFLPDAGLRKKLIGNYILYYLIDCQKEMIFIVRIVYGKRNMDEILRQLNL